jgi:sporulation protein YtfJ
MDKHPISELMSTTMEKIKEMVDVNTVVGDPIVTPDGITLIPVSKVSFAFGSGGSDYQTKYNQAGQQNPFGGGSGAGIKVTPVAFLVAKEGSIKVLSINTQSSTTVDRLAEMLPDIIDKVSAMIKKDTGE